MEQSRVAIVPLDAEHDVASLIDVDLARVAHHDLDREIFIVNVNQDTLHGGNVDSVVRHFVTLIFGCLPTTIVSFVTNLSKYYNNILLIQKHHSNDIVVYAMPKLGDDFVAV